MEYTGHTFKERPGRQLNRRACREREELAVTTARVWPSGERERELRKQGTESNDGPGIETV